MTPDQRDALAVVEMSDKAFVDGIELFHLIEVLEKQNTGGLNEKLSAADAGGAALVIRNGVISRIVLLVAGAYAPVRSDGDLHLRRAFALLKRPAIRQELNRRGSSQYLDEATKLWNECSTNDARLKPIKHFRDKYTAHSSEPIKDIPLPAFKDLFGFTRDTIAIMDKFARGTGTRTEPLSDWQAQAAESADRFWNAWKKS